MSKALGSIPALRIKYFSMEERETKMEQEILEVKEEILRDVYALDYEKML